MARKRPVSVREQELGGRLRVFRVHNLRLSRVVVAEELSVGVSRLASYESGRVPIPFDVAQRLAGAFRLNYEWLAEGKGDAFDELFVGPALRAEIPPRMLFSAAYDRFIKPALRQLSQESPTILMKAVGANPELQNLVRPGRTIGIHGRREVKEMLSAVIAAHLGSLPSHLVWPFGRSIAAAAASFHCEQSSLTETSLKSSFADMRSELPHLIARVRRATSQRGKQAELAALLNVPQARISEWLSGKKEPGGESTLRLLAWVQAEEAKLKSPGRADNTTRAETRRRSSSDEKPKSSRQKS